MAEDVVAIRKKVMEFIDGPEGYLKIPYEGPDLNPRRFWHKIVLQSRLRFLWQTAVIFLCTILPSGEFKNRLLRSIGMNIGREAFIAPMVFFDIEFPRLVSIGEGAGVAMNSFVNRDVPPFTVVGGSPLQEIKKLDKLL